MSEWYDAIGPSKITDNLWISGYKAAADLWDANPAGITHVLNVSTNPPYLEAEGIDYCYVPFHDGEAIPPKAFATCLAFLRFANDHNGKILIHCAAGISRSVTITASWLHYSHQLEFNDALTHIMNVRPIANPAVSVMNSARRLLGAWPYDGSQGTQFQDRELIQDAVIALVSKKAEDIHPDPLCPVRAMLTRQSADPKLANAVRHTIKCTCPIISK